MRASQLTRPSVGQSIGPASFARYYHGTLASQGTIHRPRNLAGESWGGLAAMLVALPSAIAFGVTVLAPLGADYAAQGALVGIIGTIFLGLIAPAFGGTDRLITSPSAPAAAVLVAYSVQLVHNDVPAHSALLMLTLVGLLCGAFQIAFSVLGLGRLIKYMPYPVVSGFMTGVGFAIVLGQVPKFLGAQKGATFFTALTSPAQWNARGAIVGAVTVAVMLLAPRMIKAVPAAILGLAAGGLTYLALAFSNPAMRTLTGNAMVIGPLGTGGGILASLRAQIAALSTLNLSSLAGLVTPALTLAVLLSIDTLKTSAILDSLTRTRHNSKRELLAQGLANAASALAGGMPGSGQTGATLVNMSSGGQTRLSGLLEGVFALLAFVLLRGGIAWLPTAALAGILIVVGVRMCDRNSLNLLRSRSTILDFAVVAAVVIVALSVSLIAASATGIGLAILLFLREQARGSVIRGKTTGSETFSRRVRLPEEMAILERRGERTLIVELQGSLFFGTADQLLSGLGTELGTHDYVVLDMRRVLDVDVTAARVLDQIESILEEHGAMLIFCHFAMKIPSGENLAELVERFGIVRPERKARTFPTRDDALMWIEDRILAEEMSVPHEIPLTLAEMSMFAGRKPETLAALEACMEARSYKAGDKVFSRHDTDGALILIRRGAVRITVPVAHTLTYHLGTYGRGNFIGELAFLDRKPRSADAVALTDTDLYFLPRERFDALAEQHKMIAVQLLEAVASTLASRLRSADRQLRAAQEG